LRDPSEWRLIGKPMQRVDIVAKSTGTQLRHRHKIDGMVHAAIVLNPAQTGPMNSFDASEALKMRGISKVVAVTGGVGVIADNTWRAFQAAEAIEFDWGPAPSPPRWTSIGRRSPTASPTTRSTAASAMTAMSKSPSPKPANHQRRIPRALSGPCAARADQRDRPGR
jgi:CO/xanthine dehydrogenase Mo-binding subunit